MAQRKRRWRKRQEPPKRQWVLQEQVEFLETMMAKRQKKADIYPADKLSSRYEGIPEHNPSHFVLMECRNSNAGADGSTEAPTIQVTLLPAPPNTNVTFAQPASRKTLSMSEAEQAIQDQRTQTSRYMMHNKGHQPSYMNNAAGGNKPVNQSKARLMGKLQQVHNKAATTADGGGEEEGDDIMGDVAFRERKGGSRARKELLNTMGDEGVKVDDDGVLGGTNDEEFGGKRHFGAFRAAQDDKKKAAGDENAATAEKGNAGMAMEDGFYQRDVKAEYEELDYDVDEQFDDDDVDVGETEVAVDTGGFAQDDDDDDEVAEEEEGGGEAVSGAEGLASVAGFKAMLAKARGEGTNNDDKQTNDVAPGTAANPEAAKAEAAKLEEARRAEYIRAKRKATIDPSQKHLDDIFSPEEKPGGKEDQTTGGPQKPKKSAASTEPQFDANGLRIVSLGAIRREIWLNHGSIAMKRLLKLFDINKKTSSDRQNKFREVIKELCTMKSDPVGGRMLVLKQHYSNMVD